MNKPQQLTKFVVALRKQIQDVPLQDEAIAYLGSFCYKVRMGDIQPVSFRDLSQCIDCSEMKVIQLQDRFRDHYMGSYHYRQNIKNALANIKYEQMPIVYKALRELDNTINP